MADAMMCCTLHYNGMDGTDCRVHCGRNDVHPGWRSPLSRSGQMAGGKWGGGEKGNEKRETKSRGEKQEMKNEGLKKRRTGGERRRSETKIETKTETR